MDNSKLQLFRSKAIQSGYDPKEVDKFIEARQTEQAQAGLVQKGVLDITDLAKTDPKAALKLAEQGYKAKGDDKTQKALSATSNFIDLLEQRFQESGGGEYSGLGARISGVGKSAAAAVGANSPAKVYNDQRRGFAATLKQLTGDTGVLTENDFKRLSGLVPDLGSTPEEAMQKFNDLRSQVAASFGGAKTTTSYKAPQSKGGAIAALFPSTTEKVKELQSQGQEYQKNPSFLKSLKLAYEATPISAITNPKTRASLAEAQTYGGVAEGGLAIKKFLSGLTVGNALAKRTATATASEAKLSGDQIVKTAEANLGKVSEADKTVVEKLIKSAKKSLSGKQLTPQEALDKIAQYNKAYTSTGAAGKSGKAFFNDIMSKAMRQELANQAPEVAAAQETLKRALGIKAFAKRSVFPAAVGAGVSLPLYALLRRFGGQGNQ